MRPTGDWRRWRRTASSPACRCRCRASRFRLWLSDSGAGLAVVGLTAWIGLAYSLKFLWAPLLDQSPPLPPCAGSVVGAGG